MLLSIFQTGSVALYNYKRRCFILVCDKIFIIWIIGWVSDKYLQVLAEIMDFGYPQNLSPEILKLYITQEGVRSPFSSKVSLHVLL